MSFMSTAPRPQTQPSATSPANGSCVQSAASRRHDVEVAVDEQRRAAGSSPSIRATTTGPPVGRLEDLRLEPDLGSFAATYSAAARSPGPRAVAVVGRVDADQVAAEVDDLVLRRSVRRCGGSGTVPPRGRVRRGVRRLPAPAILPHTAPRGRRRVEPDAPGLLRLPRAPGSHPARLRRADNTSSGWRNWQTR